MLQELGKFELIHAATPGGLPFVMNDKAMSAALVAHAVLIVP